MDLPELQGSARPCRRCTDEFYGYQVEMRSNMRLQIISDFPCPLPSLQGILYSAVLGFCGRKPPPMASWCLLLRSEWHSAKVNAPFRRYKTWPLIEEKSLGPNAECYARFAGRSLFVQTSLSVTTLCTIGRCPSCYQQAARTATQCYTCHLRKRTPFLYEQLCTRPMLRKRTAGLG